jgi:hypothetical protein
VNFTSSRPPSSAVGFHDARVSVPFVVQSTRHRCWKAEETGRDIDTKTLFDSVTVVSGVALRSVHAREATAAHAPLMAHTHYERISVDGDSRAHLGHNISRSCASTQPCETVYTLDSAELIRCTDISFQAQNDRGSRTGNQVGQQTIHGDQHIHL